MPPTPFDFGHGAAEYAKLSRDVSKSIASAALKRIPPLDSNSLVLDLACGTGEVTGTVIENAAAQDHQPPPTVIGLDIAPGMVQLYSEKAASNAWTTASAKVQDAQNLGEFSNNHLDLVFMNFGIMFVPDSIRCAKEVHRVLKPGGYAVFTTWKDPGVPCLTAEASAAVGHVRPTPIDDDWGTKEKLVSTTQNGGFSADHIEVLIEATKFERGSGDGIVQALSVPFWNPIHDNTPEAMDRWQSALRQQLTPAQKESGSVDMIAWVCIARKLVEGS